MESKAKEFDDMTPDEMREYFDMSQEEQLEYQRRAYGDDDPHVQWFAGLLEAQKAVIKELENAPMPKQPLGLGPEVMAVFSEAERLMNEGTCELRTETQRLKEVAI